MGMGRRWPREFPIDRSCDVPPLSSRGAIDGLSRSQSEVSSHSSLAQRKREIKVDSLRWKSKIIKMYLFCKLRTRVVVRSYPVCIAQSEFHNEIPMTDDFPDGSAPCPRLSLDYVTDILVCCSVKSPASAANPPLSGIDSGNYNNKQEAACNLINYKKSELINLVSVLTGSGSFFRRSS